MYFDVKGEKGREQAKEIAAQELALTEAALVENSKSYYAWFHRLWVVRKGLLPLDNELKKVNRFHSVAHPPPADHNEKRVVFTLQLVCQQIAILMA